ncbi:MAG: GAF domain-containing protein [Lachnospiraceae bacterium]|nr:GAF domain-containing protein [Lachnospiraceae bacterium]
MTDYRGIRLALEGLTEGIPYPIANLANAAALLFEQMPGLNWAGFYLTRVRPDGGRELVLGPFQGRPACIVIPWGRGVCGTAAARNAAQLVADVHEFPGHIACDAASASEAVIPLHGPDGSVAGVLDLDSPRRGRFSEEDLAGLMTLVPCLEACLPAVCPEAGT